MVNGELLEKRQFLFDFPSHKFLEEFCNGIGAITGHSGDQITIGERHIKVYYDNATDFPAPHMDRQAAEFTIGFPIYIADDSKVCFFLICPGKRMLARKPAL